MADFLQSIGEAISYKIDTTNWGGSPSSVSVQVLFQGQDVTAVLMPVNSPSVSADDITLSPLRNLVSGNIYEVKVQFISGGNTLRKTVRVEAVS